MNRLAVVGYLILTAVVIGVLYRGDQIQNRQEQQIKAAEKERAAIQARFAASDRALRDQDEKQLEAIRTILCLANRQVQTSRQRTPEEKTRSAEFYRQALRSIGAQPCERTEP